MADVVEQYLSTGEIGNADANELAELVRTAVHREVQRSTDSGLKMARLFVRRARPDGGVLLQAAYRALGWAFHVANKYGAAKDAYLEARQLALRDPLVRGKIDRVLIDVYMYLGDDKEARKRAHKAMSTFERIGNKAEREATRVNYANLLHRQDRHREAFEQYRAARRYFEKGSDRLKLALCAYNEANTLVQLIEFPEALKRYKKAESIFREFHYDLYANEAVYGVAWLQMLQGNYHEALTLLIRAKQEYSRHGHPHGVVLCLLDIAEIYSNLNLWTDSLHAARLAESQAKRLGTGYELAKAAFFRSQAAYAIGRVAESRKAIFRARRGFEAVGNKGFLAAVEFFETSFAAKTHGPDLKSLKQTRSLFGRAQLPVWEAMCDLQLVRSSAFDRTAFKRLKTNPAVQSIPYLLAEWQIVQGDIEALNGGMEKARINWTRAADILDELRVKLPPIELRSNFMKGRTSPHERLVEAQAEANPADAAAWSERWRTAGLWAPLISSESDSAERTRARESLSRLAHAVSDFTTRLTDSTGSRGTAQIEHNSELEQIQRRIRQDLSMLEKGHVTREHDIARLKRLFRTVAKQAAIVQFQQVGDDLLAFVHADSGIHFHRFVDGRRKLLEFTGWWQILLSRSMMAAGRGSERDIAEENSLFRELGDWLWGNLEVPPDTERVVLLPDGMMFNLPWTALAPGGKCLLDRYDLVAAPSLRHFLHAQAIRVSSQKGMIFVGRSDDLPEVRSEVSELGGKRGLKAELKDRCRREDWPDSGEAKFWHYAGHARFRSDNPLYSSLSLEDGPLFAADFRLKRTRVELITLAACRTGQQIYMPGEQSSGLVRSLLEMGARTVIAGNWAVDDASTALWMREFYNRYLRGATANSAARAAVESVRDEFPSALHWAAFSVFGAF